MSRNLHSNKVPPRPSGHGIELESTTDTPEYIEELYLSFRMGQFPFNFPSFSDNQNEGEDAAKTFYNKITKEVLLIAKNYLDIEKPKIITNEQETEYEKENNCHMCKKSLMDLAPIIEKRQGILNEIIEYWQFKMFDVVMKYWYIEIKGNPIFDYEIHEADYTYECHRCNDKIKELEDEIKIYNKKIEKYEKKRNVFLVALEDNMRKIRDQDNSMGKI
ncbi:Hypothetical protein CINCED_3A015363 [Cinara cedri]|uniref:Uncharacterized protein n=1 Tax=Cinara cedri TaxID=506608 RepID=A0A5E4MHM9_9HEMI|nr:Hypothetical protein CINCED_3A015363 [Cinara cedri]